MALAGLFTRLNSGGYKNWMKAGNCLHLLQSPLLEYVEKEMQMFHRQLANRITAPRQKRCQCRARGKQFKPSCPVCAQWKELILAHHNNRNGDIHWGNSNPSLWPFSYWEVAKVYMQRGQTQDKGPKECDAPALLNLINNCDHFKVQNISRVREVIKCRNELMHSSDMKVTTSWLSVFGQKMRDLITEFRHVPGLVREGEKMQEILLSDWKVGDLGINEVDGPGKITFQSQSGTLQRAASTTDTRLSPAAVEIILIKQLIQELYLEIEEHGSLTKEDEVKISKMKNFLSKNEDLKLVFREDLERLDSLWRNRVSPNVEGWIYRQRFAVVFVAFSLALLIAFLLGQK